MFYNKVLTENLIKDMAKGALHGALNAKVSRRGFLKGVAAATAMGAINPVTAKVD